MRVSPPAFEVVRGPFLVGLLLDLARRGAGGVKRLGRVRRRHVERGDRPCGGLEPDAGEEPLVFRVESLVVRALVVHVDAVDAPVHRHVDLRERRAAGYGPDRDALVLPADRDRLAPQGEVRVLVYRVADLGLYLPRLEVVGEGDAQRGLPAVLVGLLGVRAPQGVAVGVVEGVGLALDGPPRGMRDGGPHRLTAGLLDRGRAGGLGLDAGAHSHDTHCYGQRKDGEAQQVVSVAHFPLQRR